MTHLLPSTQAWRKAVVLILFTSRGSPASIDVRHENLQTGHLIMRYHTFEVTNLLSPTVPEWAVVVKTSQYFAQVRDHNITPWCDDGVQWGSKVAFKHLLTTFYGAFTLSSSYFIIFVTQSFYYAMSSGHDFSFSTKKTTTEISECFLHSLITFRQRGFNEFTRLTRFNTAKHVPRQPSGVFGYGSRLNTRGLLYLFLHYLF